MLETRKVTVHLPQGLLDSAMEETGKGVTETIREGLKLLARERAYKGLLALKGKVKPKYSLEVLRYDKE
jgi:hypothetical protein